MRSKLDKFNLKVEQSETLKTGKNQTDLKLITEEYEETLRQSGAAGEGQRFGLG